MKEEEIERLIEKAFADSCDGPLYKQFVQNLKIFNDISFLEKARDKNKLGELLANFYVKLFPFALQIASSRSDLLEVLLGFNWQFYSPQKRVFDTFKQLILQTLSFDSKLLPKIFTMVAEVLNNRLLRVPDAVKFSSKSKSPTLKFILSDSFERVYSKAHDLASQITTLFPFSSREYFLALVRAFPFKGMDRFSTVSFVSNLIRVGDYNACLRGQIVSLVFCKMNELDVEVSSSFDMTPDCSVFTHFIKRNLFSFSDEISDFISILLQGEMKVEMGKDHNLRYNEQLRNPKDEEMKEKLESVSLLLLDYLHSAKEEEGLAEKLFDSLLEAFDREILKNRIKNTPFVVFYLSVLSNSFVEKLIDFLIERITGNARSIEIRRNSIAFISGFVVHCKSVKKIIVLKVFGILLKMAELILMEFEPERMMEGQNLKGDVHTLFFTLCEAIFYIFIYRHEELSESSDYERKICTLKLLISSKMNPLQFCAREVILAFSAFSFGVEALDCFPVLLCNYRFFKRDKSNVLSERSGFESLDTKCFFARKRTNFLFGKTSIEAIKWYVGNYWISEKDLHEKVAGIFKNRLNCIELGEEETLNSELSDEEKKDI